MGVAFALFHLALLLAAPDRPRRPKRTFGDGQEPARGRRRYAPPSTKPRGGKNRNGGNQQPRGRPQQEDPEEAILPVVPPLTGPSGPFPTFFTCRHTYEETLVEEITRYAPEEWKVQASSSCPGLVHVDGLQWSAEDHNIQDPVYALQALPDCRIVECPNSIKGLARVIAEQEAFLQRLANAPRGSLSIHALVPGMCKGQTNPIWQRRANLVAEAVADIWKGQFAAARKAKDDTPSQRLLLQVLLLSPDVAAASLAVCQPTAIGAVWPNPNYPVGMARADIATHKMPSSAYRKLLEAFACLERRPLGGDKVVDLGASPGGWTKALLLYCGNEDEDEDTYIQTDGNIDVLAVDRSPLDPKLLKDPRVSFVQGDAFAYEPPRPPVAWMVSDIIAYPDRIVELIDRWCGKALAASMIVTMKFQGNTPSWEDLDQALQVAHSHGYNVRVKHFFNNKNEVTLMLQQKQAPAMTGRAAPMGKAIPPFYAPVMSSQGNSKK